MQHSEQESVMASAGHLESYLNKDVSVITTREIRYQGELASFDKENRTITLRKGEPRGSVLANRT